MRLEGKVAVITGGGRGQGRAHAETFAREGADLVVCDIDFQVDGVPYRMNEPGDLAETKRLVEAAGGRCVTVKADARDGAQVAGVVETALSEFGRLDIMIANAGGWWPGTVEEMTDTQWKTVLDLNLKSAFNAIRAAAPPMIEQQSGRIIVTCSNLGRQGIQNMSNYVASRWGQLGLVKSAAIELGPHNITVNAVCPTITETPQVTHDLLYRLFRPDLENPTREDVEEFIRMYLHKLPTAWAQPQDIAEAMLFLASDEARLVTGIGLDVSAGQATQYAA
jgi:SDR family mycofactocin-dependent oxidoreductase